MEYENLTAETLAEAIIAVFKGYEILTRNMTKEEQAAFDKDLKDIIKDQKIF